MLFLKTFWWIFLELLPYNCLYFEMAFLMHSLLYLVVILRASLFAVRAMVAILVIHSSTNVSLWEGRLGDACMPMCCYLIYDGVVSPICVVFYYTYCFANKVVYM